MEHESKDATGHRFTACLMRCTFKFILGLGASYLVALSRQFLPANIMGATFLQLVLYALFGLIATCVVLVTVYYALCVVGLLWRAYEAGAKVLNGYDHRNDF